MCFRYYIKGYNCALIFARKYNLLYICYLNCQPAQPACLTFEFHQTKLSVNITLLKDCVTITNFYDEFPQLSRNQGWIKIARKSNFVEVEFKLTN